MTTSQELRAVKQVFEWVQLLDKVNRRDRDGHLECPWDPTQPRECAKSLLQSARDEGLDCTDLARVKYNDAVRRAGRAYVELARHRKDMKGSEYAHLVLNPTCAQARCDQIEKGVRDGVLSWKAIGTTAEEFKKLHEEMTEAVSRQPGVQSALDKDIVDVINIINTLRDKPDTSYGSVSAVIDHARQRAKRGKQPSMALLRDPRLGEFGYEEFNPRKALKRAFELRRRD